MADHQSTKCTRLPSARANKKEQRARRRTCVIFFARFTLRSLSLSLMGSFAASNDSRTGDGESPLKLSVLSPSGKTFRTHSDLVLFIDFLSDFIVPFVPDDETEREGGAEAMEVVDEAECSAFKSRLNLRPAPSFPLFLRREAERRGNVRLSRTSPCSSAGTGGRSGRGMWSAIGAECGGVTEEGRGGGGDAARKSISGGTSSPR